MAKGTRSVYAVNPKLKCASAASVKRAETTLKTHFPHGYSSYVTTLGEGVYCNLIRVYSPQAVMRDLAEFRDRVKEYFCWDEGTDVLSKNRVCQSIWIADTLQGDELIFHPDNPAKLYVLPRDAEIIYEVGSTFDEALDWMANSGKLTDGKSTSPYFNSGIGEKRIELISVKLVKNRMTMSKLKSELLKLALHDLVVQAQESDGSSLISIFVRAFAGEILVGGKGREYFAAVSHACKLPCKPLDRILTELEKNGIVPPIAADGKPHPAIGKLRDEFFQLTGIIPPPIPRRDREPRDVVLAFIRAMHVWETGMSEWSNEGYPKEDGLDLISTIFAELSVAKRNKFDYSYSIPSLYCPESVTIVEEQEISPDKVQIKTNANNPLGSKHTFVLRRRNEIWQLHEVWYQVREFDKKQQHL